MAKLGWLGLPFAEEYGGAGLGLVELALVLEEIGRAAYPGPYFARPSLGGLGIALGGQRGAEGEVALRDRLGQARLTAALARGSARLGSGGHRGDGGAGGRRLDALRRRSASCRGPTSPTRSSSRRARPRASRCSSWTRAPAGVTLSPDGRHRPRHALVGAARSTASPSAPTPCSARPAGPAHPRVAAPPGRGGRRRGDAGRGPALPRHERRTTRRCASSSASRSAPSRPSATSARRCSWRPRTRTPPCTTRRGRSTRAPRTRRWRRRSARSYVERGRAQGVRRGHPGARRHRLHVGVRPAPLLQAGEGARADVRRRGLPPRADRSGASPHDPAAASRGRSTASASRPHAPTSPARTAGMMLADLGAARDQGGGARGRLLPRAARLLRRGTAASALSRVNLKSPDGRAIVHRLAAEADVVMENMRPGVADRLGLGYERSAR